MNSIANFEWDEIETLFLDMDGTLLDLQFDNHFWLEYVPQKYAEKYNLSLEKAKAQLYRRFNAIQGTLNWYSIDYWTEELGLDLELLKQEIDHLIQIHPCVTDFLSHMKSSGKRLVLLTNAHQKVLKLKMEKTQLAGYFDNVITSHDIGLPKEDIDFWEKLQETEAYSKTNTLFVDDSLPVLAAARSAGIKYLLAISKPDTKQDIKDTEDYVAVEGFCEVVNDLFSQ